MNYSKQTFKDKRFKDGEMDNNNYSYCIFDNCKFPKKVTMSNFSHAKAINCKLLEFIDSNLSFFELPENVKTTRCNRCMIEPEPTPEPEIVVPEIKPDINNEIECPTCMTKIKVKK